MGSGASRRRLPPPPPLEVDQSVVEEVRKRLRKLLNPAANEEFSVAVADNSISVAWWLELPPEFPQDTAELHTILQNFYEMLVSLESSVHVVWDKVVDLRKILEEIKNAKRVLEDISATPFVQDRAEAAYSETIKLYRKFLGTLEQQVTERCSILAVATTTPTAPGTLSALGTLSTLRF